MNILEKKANPTNTVKTSLQRTEGGDSMLTDRLVPVPSEADLNPLL